MRRILSEIDKRVRIYLDKNIKMGGVNGIMDFGSNNDYPQITERLINGSVTAKAISDIKARFFIGDGFEDETVRNIIVGKDCRGKNITMQSLLMQVSYDLAKHNGCYIHQNIYATLKGKDAKYIPFKYCRFAKPDDLGYSAKICVYENWEKDSDIKFDKTKIKDYYIFSSEKSVIEAQINGQFDKYNGNINFLFFDNQYFYPLSTIDSVYLDADSEAQIALYKNNQLRNGMLDKILVRVAPSATEEEGERFVKDLKKALGADGDPVVILEDEIDPDTNQIRATGAFQIDTIKSNVNDKLFENWEKSIVNNIRKANDAPPTILIEYVESNLGTTSGEAIQQAVNFYNAITKSRRTQISEFFSETFRNFEGIPQGANFNIAPLTLTENTTIQMPKTQQ